jgi:hypothetical protein
MPRKVMRTMSHKIMMYVDEDDEDGFCSVIEPSPGVALRQIDLRMTKTGEYRWRLFVKGQGQIDAEFTNSKAEAIAQAFDAYITSL